jgi:uncharacterized protein
MRFYFSLCFLCLLAPPAWAEFQVPRLTGPVVDQAGMLSDSTRERLESFLRRLHESGGTQLQVLTVHDLGGLAIEQASIQVTDEWKLGGAKEDNGVLLMIAQQERKVRIEVGQGREGVLPDVVASRIIREVITPRFRQGALDNGVVEGVIAIVRKTDPDFLASAGEGRPAHDGEGKISGRTLELLIFVLFFTVVLLPPLFGRRRGGRGMFFPGGFGGGGFGGSSGGGGWSGGGGGFSGGGASGDW